MIHDLSLGCRPNVIESAHHNTNEILVECRFDVLILKLRMCIQFGLIGIIK